MRTEYTPSSKIRAALRQLWLRSRERARALKEQGYTCQKCHKKQSKAQGRVVKVEVHHKEGICNWRAMEEEIRKELLVFDSTKLEVLCVDCHKEETKKGN